MPAKALKIKRGWGERKAMTRAVVNGNHRGASGMVVAILWQPLSLSPSNQIKDLDCGQQSPHCGSYRQQLPQRGGSSCYFCSVITSLCAANLDCAKAPTTLQWPRCRKAVVRGTLWSGQ